MPDWQPSGTVETLEIASLDRKALLIRTKAESAIHDIAGLLGQEQSRIALLILGGADQLEPALQEKLKTVFSGTILPLAIEADALILDGTRPATMQLIGDCAAFRRNPPSLAGVAPISCVMFPGST